MFWRSGEMKKARPLAVLVGFFILQASASSRLPAAQEAAQAVKPLQYEVSVVLKLIHVYVTDKKGNPVRDLTKDDFVVYDNGRPMTVTDFERHALESLPVKAEPAPPAPEAAAPAPPAVPATSRKFFLFFDFAFNNARGVIKAKKAALHFLATEVRPDDEVGIVTYSMLMGVGVPEYLTVDHRKIREALEKIGQGDIAGRASEIEDQYWRLVVDGVNSPRGGVSSAQAQLPISEANALRQESRRIAQTFILKLTDLAKALRLIPGQKQFIFFSAGIPSSLVYGTQAGNPQATGVGRSQFDAGDRVLRTQNEDMYREFSASGCTFYAFDTRETAKVASLFVYDEQTFANGGRGMFGAQGVFQDVTDQFKDDKTTGLNSLKRLTDITAGKYYSNINMYQKNLDQVQSLTGTYYVLGYAIGEQWDGQFHEIKVEVRRKGCEVRAQAGYFNPKPYREYTDLERELHLFDLALNERSLSRLPVNFPMTTLSFSSGKESGLEMLARVPAGILEKFSGQRVEFLTIVFDERDNIRDVRRTEADPGRYRGRALVFAAGAALQPGDYKCRLVVRDMDTGMSAVGSARGSVGPEPAPGLRLHTPLLLVRETSPALLEAPSGKMNRFLTWTDTYPFDRLNFSPFAGDVPAGVERVWAVIPCSVPGNAQPDLAVAAYLIHSVTGERTPVPFSLVEKSQWGPLEVLTLEFPVAGLAPATYLLYIYAEDPGSRTIAHVQTAVTIPQR
jgi:VWFA-related protein